MDNPSNWYMWDIAAVPFMFLLMFGMVPYILSLVREDDLYKLKKGAFVQLFATIVCGILGGMAYGEWDKDYYKNTRKNLEQYDYNEPYNYPDNQILPQEAIFYYDIKQDPADDNKWNVDELEDEQHLHIFTMCGFLLGAAVLFLTTFGFSLSYLCHIYYGPRGGPPPRSAA